MDAIPALSRATATNMQTTMASHDIRVAATIAFLSCCSPFLPFFLFFQYGTTIAFLNNIFFFFRWKA